jgi:hypothetical protein
LTRHHHQPVVRQKNFGAQTLILSASYEVFLNIKRVKRDMKLKEKIEELAATGYILLWLLGVPIPVLLLFFLLRGCT